MTQRRKKTVRGRRLSMELKRLREAAGLSGEQAASRLQWSQSKVSRIETGRIAVSNKDLRALLDLYQVPQDKRDRCFELAKGAKIKGWWEAYADAIPRDYADYIELENAACSVLTYSPQIVSGVLQTEEYAQRVVQSALLISPPGEVARRVKVRMERQERLMSDHARTLSVVLDEAALQRHVGGPKVMEEQLRHLVSLAEQPNLTVRVLLSASGEHPATAGEFTILKFPDSDDTDVVHVEAMTSSLYVEEEAEVFRYVLAFNQLCSMALSPSESTALITELADGERRQGR
ncbi:helix-turn-helix transcriptional regulator [Nocardiopsis sp. CNT312]|uniref:helix-turn-helix domain-containing protein n=1 Tax=Nocardiopsis sp. CNT312 TaxID=1137268 RepID=UPI00048B2375|nr:helix-turn-helix transcriptional regulator [Nocardiopsis sp. CNT312]